MRKSERTLASALGYLLLKGFQLSRLRDCDQICRRTGLHANLADSIALAAEAGRRRLAAAVPSLEALCRRFSGFGIDRMVPEQAAALQALAVISGRDAAQAVSQLIVRGVVQGPALNLAVSTAARIGSALPADVLRSLLRHPDPAVRASIC